jgi:hypothetical protein
VTADLRSDYDGLSAVGRRSAVLVRYDAERSTVDRLARFVWGRCLGRVAGLLWIAHDIFDWDDQEPKDYYRGYFEDADGKPLSRLVQVRPDGLDVRLWDAPTKTFVQEDIADRYLDRPLRLRRTLKNEIEVRYNSEREFLLKDWWWPRVVQLRKRLFQRAGNYIRV